MTIPGAPVSKPRMTQRDRWKKRPCVLKFFAYRDLVRRLATPELQQAEALIMEFYLPFPKSYSKKLQAVLQGHPHRKKPDLDNLQKAVMDSLFTEDCRVYAVHARKYWDDGQGPRTIVTHWGS